MKIAIFPGSFDPITNGHLDLIKRASKLFDELVIVIGINTNKKGMFTPQEKIDLVKTNVKQLFNVKVMTENGLTVDFMHQIHSHIIVRGLRNINDFQFEKDIALMNKAMDNDIETVFLLSNPNYEFVSSSILKEIVHFNGNVNQYLPQNVIKKIEQKYKRNHK